MVKDQTVTFSFFRYLGFRDKWWALAQMQKSQERLQLIPSLNFYKLLGSGRGNGFSAWPDFSVYGVLCVWESEEAAKKALNSQAVFQNMYNRSEHQLTVYMQSTRCKGTWNQQEPFDGKGQLHESEPIAVITRASIKPKQLFSFWKRVPAVSRKLESVEGVAFSKGVGEIPLLEQATFSIWKSRKHMANYAYHSKNHRDIIKKTHELGWYSEELFSEFRLLKIEQNWPGFDSQLLDLQAVPLKGI